MAPVSFPRRLAELAAASPDSPAVTCDGETLTRAELEAAATRLAHDFAGRGVGHGDFVTVAVPNSIQWFVTYIACWKLGATPQPVSARLPHRELQAIVQLASPKLVVGLDEGSIDGTGCIPVGYTPPTDTPDHELPDATSPSWKAPTSGGSTGQPKLIVSGDPAVFDPDAASMHGYVDGGCLVMPGPLYHNGPAIWSCQALLWGSHVVLLRRFDADATLAAIERYRGDVVYLVPTMMKRILALGDDVRLGYDVSSLRVVWHLAEPCPPWLKHAWIDWLGAERIVELYGGTEAQAATVIVGTEWLEHEGSVGRPVFGEIKICDADGKPLGPGEQGEVWMRSTREDPTYYYLGAEPRVLNDGWESLGDMGWLDDDGYLYLGDRMQDMILVGGSNIYPAEIEAAILEHSAVRSAVAIGLPDEERGNRIHAIVEADETEVDAEDLLAFLSDRLVTYKLPRSIEFVDEQLRDEAGKVRRSALRNERLQQP